LASVLSARYNRDAADLIVFLGRDAQALKSGLPETLREVPILALTAQHLSDDVLRAVEAEFINAPPAAMHPQIVSRPAGPSNPRAVDTSGGGARTPGLIDGHRLIGDSPAMQEIRTSIARVAATDSNVLITGETGTGKELIAELIQQNGSARSVVTSASTAPPFRTV
jgi:DNA-binding NtrC family response regulator